MHKTDEENALILESLVLSPEGVVLEYLEDAATVARKLSSRFGLPYDKEMVRTRRKRLVKARRKPTPVLTPDADEPTPYDDPHGTAYVSFLPGDSCLVVNDLHIPHHDQKAINISLAVARDVHPTGVLINGDALDFAAISRYIGGPKTPSVSREMKAARPILRAYRDVAENWAEFKFGNHEYRYIAWLWSKGRSLGALVRNLDEPEALDLEGWAITGYHQDTDLAGFRVTHGEAVRSGAGNSAEAEFGARLKSGISGHTHRAGSYSRTVADGELFWYENGCLCKKEQAYSGAKGMDWQHAFSILRHDGHCVQVEQVRIVDHRAYYGGRLYTADS